MHWYTHAPHLRFLSPTLLGETLYEILSIVPLFIGQTTLHVCITCFLISSPDPCFQELDEEESWTCLHPRRPFPELGHRASLPHCQHQPEDDHWLQHLQWQVRNSWWLALCCPWTSTYWEKLVKFCVQFVAVSVCVSISVALWIRNTHFHLMYSCIKSCILISSDRF